MERAVYDFVESVRNYDFSGLLWLLILTIVLLWVFVALWAWEDVKARTNNVFVQVLTVLAVFFLPVLGVVLYLLVRPRYTLDELLWMDLERRHLLYETEELKDCPTCGVQLSVGYKFCPQCGEQVKLVCENCEVLIPLDSAFCPFCGTPTNAVNKEWGRHSGKGDHGDGTAKDASDAVTAAAGARTDTVTSSRAGVAVEGQTGGAGATERVLSPFERLGNSVIDMLRTLFLPWLKLYESLGDGIAHVFKSSFAAARQAAKEYDKKVEEVVEKVDKADHAGQEEGSKKGGMDRQEQAPDKGADKKKEKTNEK